MSTVDKLVDLRVVRIQAKGLPGKGEEACQGSP